MAPSPPSGRRNTSLVSELAAELNRSRSEHFQSSPRVGRSSLILDLPEVTQSSFTPSKDGLVSTQQIDYDNTTDQLPQIRTTARARRFGVPRQEPQAVNTSMVAREFGDFDQNDDDDSLSIELGRGAKSKLNQSNIMSPDVFLSMIGRDSLYDMSGTPGSKSRARKSEGIERGSLRREAQVRRASSLGHRELEAAGALSAKSVRATPSKMALGDRRRTTLAEMHAKVASEAESSLMDEHPPTVTIASKNTRFGNPRSRQTSANMSLPTKYTPGKGLDNDRVMATPQRGTPRTANITANSFALPDLPNLTELVSGNYKDGTPIFSRHTPARSRLVSGKKRGYGEDPKKFNLVGEVPLPPEEKAIMASLQLLQEKVLQLEQEKAEAEHKVEEYETQVIELQAELQAREHERRADSGLGSDSEEARGKQQWRVEKTRLESNIQSLQSRLDRAERKATTSEIATKRITQERDNVVTQLGVAFMEQEELKAQNEALRAQNDTLRDEVDSLRLDNEDLQHQLSGIAALHQDETQRWATEKVEIQKRAGRPDRTVLAENENLREELARTKAQHEEETQRFNLEKAQLRKQALEESRAEYKKLKVENSRLRTQLEEAKAAYEEEARKETAREDVLKGKSQRRASGVAAAFEGAAQDEANEGLKRENERLRTKLVKYKRRQEDREEELRELTVNVDDLVRAAATRTRVIQEDELKNTRKSKLPSSKAPAQPTRRAVEFESVKTRRQSTNSRTGVANVSEQISDIESTTNLDLTPRPEVRQQKRTNTQQAARRMTTLPAIEAPTMNDTYLSLLEPELVGNLRKRIEELHLAERQRKSTSQEKADTIRSMLSEGGGLTRNTLTGFIGQTFDADDNKENQDTVASKRVRDRSATRREDTKQSLLSNTSRRRRSAPPVEMTSAFILPDITLRNPTIKLTQLGDAHVTTLHTKAPHDAKTCTVCARAISKASGVEITVDIPTPIPINERPEIVEDVDATMRPSQPPRIALASVIKQLQDELVHIQLELVAEEAKLNAHDPAQGRRKRRAIEARIIELTELHRVKADMVYALFDVLEGQKGEAHLTEDEVNETLRSVGIDVDEIRRENGRRPKKVVIDDLSDTEDNSFRGLDSEVSEELPWEGFSDVESVHSRRVRRRSGVF